MIEIFNKNEGNVMREHLATLLCNASGGSYGVGGAFQGPVSDKFMSKQELIEEDMESMLDNCDTYWCLLACKIVPNNASPIAFLDMLDRIAGETDVNIMYEWLTPYDAPWWESGQCPAGDAGILWVAFMQVLNEVTNTYLNEI